MNNKKGTEKSLVNSTRAMVQKIALHGYRISSVSILALLINLLVLGSPSYLIWSIPVTNKIRTVSPTHYEQVNLQFMFRESLNIKVQNRKKLQYFDKDISTGIQLTIDLAREQKDICSKYLPSVELWKKKYHDIIEIMDQSIQVDLKKLRDL